MMMIDRLRVERLRLLPVSAARPLAARGAHRVAPRRRPDAAHDALRYFGAD